MSKWLTSAIILALMVSTPYVDAREGGGCGRGEGRPGRNGGEGRYGRNGGEDRRGGGDGYSKGEKSKIQKKYKDCDKRRSQVKDRDKSGGDKDGAQPDSQDQKENRGHGNNTDGQDDNNPGKGSGGPNADPKDGLDTDEK
ncbi:MAG TPA: hypothetical protein VIR63_05975 [Pontiella sp.]